MTRTIEGWEIHNADRMDANNYGVSTGPVQQFGGMTKAEALAAYLRAVLTPEQLAAAQAKGRAQANAEWKANQRIENATGGLNACHRVGRLADKLVAESGGELDYVDAFTQATEQLGIE